MSSQVREKKIRILTVGRIFHAENWEYSFNSIILKIYQEKQISNFMKMACRLEIYKNKKLFNFFLKFLNKCGYFKLISNF